MNLELLSNILLGYWKLTQQYMAFWYNNFGPQNLSNCGFFEDWFVPLHISEFRSPFDSEFAPLNSGKVQLLTAIKLDPPGQWTSEKYLALETSLLAMGWSETLLWNPPMRLQQDYVQWRSNYTSASKNRLYPFERDFNRWTRLPSAN